MFTGLIEKTGELASRTASGGAGNLVVRTSPWSPPLVAGESVCVQGVCLTLRQADNSVMSFDILEETFERSSLGRRKVGDRLNLERSLRLGDRLGGHMVTGHVDGVGVVKSLTRVGRDWAVRVSCGRDLLADMVAKGSIACDGISLTIVELLADSFVVHIIPHTWTETSSCRLRTGDEVNIETDVLGKYVRRFLQNGITGERITWDKLRDAGFE
jgi:riboflavin synthase